VCFYGGCSGPAGQPRSFDTGLAWVTRATAASLATPRDPLTRPPRRQRWLIALSSRLPVPLLLGLRLAARVGARRPPAAILAAEAP